MSESGNVKLIHAVDAERDHVRGADLSEGAVSIVYYGDFLCPYCRRLREVLLRLRESIGARFSYAFRHYPNERAHPGADFMARAAEAAAEQGRFWDMHDALYRQGTADHARTMRANWPAASASTWRASTAISIARLCARGSPRISAEAGRNGVSGTPTIFIDGIRYDGAWDYLFVARSSRAPGGRAHPAFGARLRKPAGVGRPGADPCRARSACFAPTRRWRRSITPSSGHPSASDRRGSLLSLTVGEWFSEGLLAFFFLLVGLEIRRELTAGALTDPKGSLVAGHRGGRRRRSSRR